MKLSTKILKHSLTFCLLGALFFVSHLSIAQVAFSYDDAGNRILRKATSPLPVTLISFTVTKAPGNPEAIAAILNWHTATEINADHFEIQRNQNGKNWALIGNVAANGKSGSRYAYTDNDPLLVLSGTCENLYRLKMIDRDGTFAYSRIQSLTFAPRTSEDAITFYPNPIQDRLTIMGTATGMPVSGKLQLISNTGNIIYKSPNIASESINLSGLPAGIYLVHVTLPDGSTIVKKMIRP